MNKTSEISADSLLESGLNRLEELESQLQNVCRRLEKAPSGILRESVNHNTTQFYCRESSSDWRGTYIKKEDWQRAAALARKDYDERLKLELEEQIKLLRDFCSAYKPGRIAELYGALSAQRKAFVTPVYLPDDEFVEKWKLKDYERLDGSSFRAEHSVGEDSLRSKSEVIIFHSLMMHGVPFKYEKALLLKDKSGEYRTVYPDFCCLNVKTRREIYWEHFGLLDDAEYRNKMLKKLNLYAINGYVPGKNLVTSFESREVPFTQKQAELVIENYLK